MHWKEFMSKNHFRLKSVLSVLPLLALVLLSSIGSINTSAQSADLTDVNGQWYVDSTSQTQYSPSITNFEEKIYVAATGTDGSVYVKKCDTPGQCNNWQKLGGITFMSPDIYYFNGKLNVFAVGDGSNQIFLKQSSDGVTWTEWINLGGQTFLPVTNAYHLGQLCQTAVGSNQRIFTRCSNDALNWGQWFERGGETSRAVGLSSYADKLWYTVRGNDGSLYTRSCFGPADCGNWEKRDNGLTNVAPSTLTFFRNGTCVLGQVVLGSDNNFYLRFYSDLEGYWSGWNNIGARSFSALDWESFVSSVDGADKVCYVVRGTDGKIYQMCLV